MIANMENYLHHTDFDPCFLSDDVNTKILQCPLDHCCVKRANECFFNGKMDKNTKILVVK